MEFRAKGNNLRITPKKLKIAADVVRGMSAMEAVNALKYINKRSAGVALKVVESAVANAVNNAKEGAKFENLVISKVAVTEGMRYKRFRAGSRGNATRFVRRNSNLEIVLTDISKLSGKEDKKTKKEVVKKTEVKKESKTKTTKTESTKKESSTKAKKEVAEKPVKKAAAPKKKVVSKTK